MVTGVLNCIWCDKELDLGLWDEDLGPFCEDCYDACLDNMCYCPECKSYVNDFDFFGDTCYDCVEYGN